jgi:predicted nucleic acid-binding protein
MQSFYVDTCVYLNLWKKEKSFILGKPFWVHAKNFFDYAYRHELIIYYSGFLLKELHYKLTNEEFVKKRAFIESSENFLRVNLSQEEYKKADEITKRLSSGISFFDVAHLILARKTQSVFVTRDKQLLEIAEKFGVVAKKPEELVD